ncbi:hypothetical protein V1478_003897 [Vespula squamosa]|uniref:Uncharacterized protein n=1 Tax=Vespula squamosa TaxID=30214 RepID=A0ABD2BN53_VESSQ
MTSLNSCAIDSKHDTVSKIVPSPRRWRKRTNPSRQNYITVIYLDTVIISNIRILGSTLRFIIFYSISRYIKK